jgi:hypothetical protein
MAGAKMICRIFAAFRESCNSSEGSYRCQRIPAAGKNFPRIALVAYIPHNGIGFGIESFQKCDREFYHTQVAGKMAAMLQYGINQVLTAFIA